MKEGRACGGGRGEGKGRGGFSETGGGRFVGCNKLVDGGSLGRIDLALVLEGGGGEAREEGGEGAVAVLAC